MSDSIPTILARIEAGITKTRTDIMERIDRLQTSVDAIRDDIAVLGGRNDHIHRKVENTRDEARDLANSLADIHRILIKHGSRLDALERITPPKDI